MMELLPCPFCGGEAVIVKDGIWYRTKCIACFATIDNGWVSEEEAIRDWNTRKDNRDE